MVFRKIKSNLFLVIEKVTSVFQNLHEFTSDTYLTKKGILFLVKLKNGFDGFLKLMEDSN